MSAKLVAALVAAGVIAAALFLLPPVHFGQRTPALRRVCLEYSPSGCAVVVTYNPATGACTISPASLIQGGSAQAALEQAQYQAACSQAAG